MKERKRKAEQRKLQITLERLVCGYCGVVGRILNCGFIGEKKRKKKAYTRRRQMKHSCTRPKSLALKVGVDEIKKTTSNSTCYFFLFNCLSCFFSFFTSPSSTFPIAPIVVVGWHRSRVVGFSFGIACFFFGVLR